MMKILPNELPQDPDIEKVKKQEFIFKKDEELITPVDLSIETNEIDSIMPTDSVSKASTATEPFMEIISSIVDPTVSNEFDKNLRPTEGVEMMIIERKDLEKTVTSASPSDLTKATDDQSVLRTSAEDVTVFSTNQIDLHRDKENLSLPNGGVLEGSIFESFHFDDDDLDDSDEFYRPEVKTPRPTEYSSKQRSLPSSTLLHGFITNPGYPSFYIGKTTDCKWTLKLDEGQSIALTILDQHLRSKKALICLHWPSFTYRLFRFAVDEYCKDSLEIVDVTSRRTLYRGCSELSRPIQVQSSSNIVEVCWNFS